MDIYADILNTSKIEARITHIVYKANLNFILAKKYLEQLKNNGLIRKKGRYYLTTKKGIEFLENYSKFKKQFREH